VQHHWCQSVHAKSPRRIIAHFSDMGRGVRANLKCPALELDEESTDVGSNVSDAETSCSSIASLIPDTKVGQDVPLAKSKGGGGRKLGTQRKRPTTKRLTSRRTTGFKCTPLEPIPGSPSKKSDGSSLLSGPSSLVEKEVFASNGKLPPPPGLWPSPELTPAEPLSVPPVLAYAPHQNLQKGDSNKSEISLFNAHVELVLGQTIEVPLKVRLPEDSPQHVRPLDPSIPVKKRPAFPECAGISNGFLHPGVPVKKTVSHFLLEEPGFVMTSTAPAPR